VEGSNISAVVGAGYVVPQHNNLNSRPTLPKICDCFSNDTVPCHVISAILKFSQQCVFCCYYCYFSAIGRINCLLLWM